MRIKTQYCIEIDLEDGQAPFRACRIGKGRWTTAYRSETDPSEVWLFTKIDADGGTDYAKEILSFNFTDSATNPHLPFVRREAAMDNKYVYRSRYYHPLTAASKDAWKQYRTLERIAKEVYWSFVTTYRNELTQRGYELMSTIAVRARDENIPSSLSTALLTLVDECANYGQTWAFEFSKRNLAVDDDGRLILLDAIFDMEQVGRENARRRRKGTGVR